MKKTKEEKAITLIALVITIIVLLILAGVTIKLTLGDNGILKKAESSKKEYINATYSEQQQINEIGDFLTEKPKVLKYDETKLNGKMLLNNVNISEDGIIELSQSDSYITINEAFLPENNTWEITTKFKFNELRTNEQAIIGKSGTYNPLVIEIRNDGKLCVDLSSDNANWNIADKKSGTKVMQSGDWYWLKIKFNGSSYQVLISEDGENYDKDIEVISTTIIYQQDKLVLGENLMHPQKFYGYYDLKETYVKIGDTYFFNGLDYFSYK